jgi:hypothetical protein
MDSTLESILSDETPTTTETTTEQVETPVVEATGEKETTAEAPPAEERVQEDPIETHRKGLEAAVVAERRRRQELERELAALKQPKPQQQDQAQPAGRPTKDQFQTTEEYLAAVAEFEAQRAWSKREQEAQERKQQEQEQEQLTVMQRRADEVVNAGKAKFTDFDTVINDGLGPFLSRDLHEAILDADDGAGVAYWLGKNVAEAARISQKTPRQMAIEIGRIEARLQAQPEPQKQSIPQTLTQQRDAKGQFTQAYSGPTPLSDVLAARR